MHFISMGPKDSPVQPGLHLRLHVDIQLLHNLTKLKQSNTLNRHHLFKLNMDFPFPLSKDLWMFSSNGRNTNI